jgi:hypothetical protein
MQVFWFNPQPDGIADRRPAGAVLNGAHCNWRLRSMWISSVPDNVATADLKDLKDR